MNSQSKSGGRMLLWVILILLSGLIVACASSNQGPARNEIVRAETSINNAQRINAVNHAPLEMRLAQEKLQQARSEYEDEDYEKAAWLAQEAKTHADLAVAQARTAETQLAAQNLRDSITALQQETQQRQRIN